MRRIHRRLDAGFKAEKGRYHLYVSLEGGDRFTKNFRETFMQLKEVLADVMKRDRADGHSRSERGWTPPPKSTED